MIPRTRTVCLNRGEPESKRQEIAAYCQATWEVEQQLYDHLTSESAFITRADPLRHPLIFYYGHTASFYINKLIVAGLISERINPEFESIFAVGVDEMSWDDLNESHYDWPTVEQVGQYRMEVRQRVTDLIGRMELTMPIQWRSPWWVIMMGIEHARIHLETSSVLIRQLPLEMVHPVEHWEICSEVGPAEENQWVDAAGGAVKLGKSYDHRLYGWDNEYGCHQVDVAPFKVSRYLVSNQEYLAFIEDGGYQNNAWWTEEGGQWRDYVKAECPRFWQKEGGSWFLRLMAHRIAMPWNWPVEVNYLEAKAFCNWKSAQTDLPVRLPSEDEWHWLRDWALQEDQPDWQRAPGNLNLEHYCSPCPVNQFDFGGVCDVVGNVWQWTETPIYPFDGFDVHPVYDDFTTPTYDNRHNLFKGGSWISTGNEATRDCRYAFRRHFYQHAGLRYIQSDAPVIIAQVPYESEPEVCMACEAHYGPEYLGVRNFPATIAQICLDVTAGRERRRAWDLGCSVGRTSWELAGAYQEVTAMDLTARLMRVGDDLKREGKICYRLQEEGELESYHEHSLAEFGWEDRVERVTFWQGDPCNLKQKELFCDYDLVVVQDLLTGIYDPAGFLQAIDKQMTAKGVLVLVTANQWSRDRSDKSCWLGGVRKDGEPCWSWDGIRAELSDRFDLLEEPREIPRVIRENVRRYRYEMVQVSCWQKRG